jgi:hypothetical protein
VGERFHHKKVPVAILNSGERPLSSESLAAAEYCIVRRARGYGDHIWLFFSRSASSKRSLFVSQRDQWIDADRAARGQITSKHRDTEEKESDTERRVSHPRNTQINANCFFISLRILGFF